jgi:hypothetical protein
LSALKLVQDGEAAGYVTNRWPDSARGHLARALIFLGIRHRFEGEQLVVRATEVDAVTARAPAAEPARTHGSEQSNGSVTQERRSSRFVTESSDAQAERLAMKVSAEYERPC